MKKSFLLPITLAVMAFLVLPHAGPLGAAVAAGSTRRSEQIQQHKAKEGVLSTTIQGYSSRIDAVQGQISATERRLNQVQSSLDQQKEKLLAVRNRLEAARDRLERLRSRLATARTVLAQRLVEIYKADAPDALTVILESDGFGDLLERAEFLKRISDQDREITDRVRGLRDQAHRTRPCSSPTSRSRSRSSRSGSCASATRWPPSRTSSWARRDQLASVRADKRGALAQVRDSRVALEGDLAALEKEQARVQAALQGAGQTFDGPIRQGSGALIWPVNGPVVSPFGMRWGRLHAGIDIAVPSGTAIHAADGGRVVLMGWVGGYGNYTCIQHTASMSTCYGHQASFATSNGASVSQGQVIGYSDCTGHCFGPHLHFEVRINGAPVDPMGYL